MSQALAYAPRVSPAPALRSPSLSFQGRRGRARSGRLGRRHAGLQPHRRQQPALVALPEDADDVIAIVDVRPPNAACRSPPQRTGHNAEPLGALDDVILLKTDPLQGVEIDAERRVARVRAGAKWDDVVPRASELGLAALHGSTPDVSVAGYSLGGGVGWYARKLGLPRTASPRSSSSPPTAELRRVDHEHEPELFWALRGGGGNFGVVTALEFALYPINEVYAGVLFFPYERAQRGAARLARVDARRVPDEVTSVGRILQFPPLPELPEPLRGRHVRGRRGASSSATRRDGAQLIAPLRELGPAMDTFAMMPPVGLAELHMDPPTRAVRRRRARCSAS